MFVRAYFEFRESLDFSKLVKDAGLSVRYEKAFYSPVLDSKGVVPALIIDADFCPIIPLFTPGEIARDFGFRLLDQSFALAGSSDDDLVHYVTAVRMPKTGVDLEPLHDALRERYAHARLYEGSYKERPEELVLGQTMVMVFAEGKGEEKAPIPQAAFVSYEKLLFPNLI